MHLLVLATSTDIVPAFVLCSLNVSLRLGVCVVQLLTGRTLAATAHEAASAETYQGGRRYN